MYKSINLLYWEYRVKGHWEEWDWEAIYRNRKANWLSTHRGLEGFRGYSWEKKTKALGYSFKKSTKFSIDSNKSIKRL